MTGITLDSLDYEQRYLALMNGTDLAIIFLDCDGTIRTWNQAAQDLNLYTEDEVIGKHISMFYEEEEKRSGVVEKELKVAEAKGKYEGGGWRIRKDGSRFWADIIVSTLRDEDNNIIGFVKVSRDGTDRRRKEEVMLQQKQDILELSTPVIKLLDGVLVLPIVGTLDSARTQLMTEQLLCELATTGSPIAILDISGVATVDTQVAQHLMKTVEASRLMGAKCIISGIRPEIAQTIVNLGVDLGHVVTKSTLARALEEALSYMRLKITPLDEEPFDERKKLLALADHLRSTKTNFD